MTIVVLSDVAKRSRTFSAMCTRKTTMRAKPAVVNGDPRSDVKTKGDLGSLLPFATAVGPQFVPDDRMAARGALLDPADVQRGRSEVHLIPPQVNQLRHSQASCFIWHRAT
jgi:hypothetical protein